MNRQQCEDVARSIVARGAWDELPILADALEEAGFGNSQGASWWVKSRWAFMVGMRDRPFSAESKNAVHRLSLGLFDVPWGCERKVCL